MRIIRNIRRLPQVFLPIILSVGFIVCAMQLGLSVTTSCQISIDGLAEYYDAELTVSLKERLISVYDEKTGRVIGTENLNKSLIDRDVISLMSEYSEVGGARFLSNSYLIELANMMSSDEYDEMLDTLQDGEIYTRIEPVYFVTDSQHVIQLTAISCDDGYVEELAGGEVTLFDGVDEGVIIPRGLYECYGKPSSLVFGWVQTSEQPVVKVNVKGVFESEDITRLSRIICDLNTWVELYGAAFQSNGADAVDTVGLETLSVTIDDPSSVENVLSRLLQRLNGDDYLISASDYEYKFANAQLMSIYETASTVLYGGSCFIGIMLVFVLWLSLRRRTAEIRTLRTLGMSPMTAAFSVASEFVVVMAISVLLGLLLSVPLGNLVCRVFNVIMENNVNEASLKFYDSIEYFKNKSELISAFDSASEHYRSVGVKLSFDLSWRLAVWQAAATAIMSAFVLAYTSVASKKRIMGGEKR